MWVVVEEMFNGSAYEVVEVHGPFSTELECYGMDMPEYKNIRYKVMEMTVHNR